ncbi:hypothetical protein [Fictibacillus terranigra]|uniref:Uncharacterized protein n=1 Tax=Fictibacillus terranigra TaxID=3058424 RepID=A0ABT8E7P4_9BACL|nr:hypothetical protein [Fictibacillus sp. CENA-BCM004]MDN4073934.1 hypothetical protein [Fictibacillus sp. CENA-BCM004]
MSEFMRAIVQEVLKSNTPSSVKGKQEPNEVMEDTSYKQNVPELYRPNYQRLKKEKRLGGTAVPPAGREKQWQRPFSKDQSNELVSRLQVLSLSQGIPSRNLTEKNQVADPLHTGPSAKSLGKTKNGISVWLYTNLEPQMIEWFHRPIPAKAVAVFSSVACSPGQLVLIQEWLSQYPDVKYYIQWDKNGRNPFLLELYLNESTALETAIRTLFQTLDHQSEKKIKRFYIEQPGTWLIKQLDVSCTRESLAIVEGMPRYEAIALLLPISAKLSSLNIRSKIEEGYFLLYGPQQLLSSFLPDVYRMLDSRNEEGR